MSILLLMNRTQDERFLNKKIEENNEIVGPQLPQDSEKRKSEGFDLYDERLKKLFKM